MEFYKIKILDAEDPVYAVTVKIVKIVMLQCIYMYTRNCDA